MSRALPLEIRPWHRSLGNPVLTCLPLDVRPPHAVNRTGLAMAGVGGVAHRRTDGLWNVWPAYAPCVQSWSDVVDLAEAVRFCEEGPR